MKSISGFSVALCFILAVSCFSMTSASGASSRDTSQQRMAPLHLQNADLVEGYATGIEHHTGCSYVRCDDGQEICFIEYTDESGNHVGCADPNNACMGKTWYYPRFVGGVTHILTEQGEGYSIWLLYTQE